MATEYSLPVPTKLAPRVPRITVRRFLFWLHLATGSTLGVVILFLACTGSIMAFQAQIIDWAERDARVSFPGQAERLPPSALMKEASASQGGAVPTYVTLFADRSRPAEISFGSKNVLLLDPYTGKILRTDAGKLRDFFLTVRDLHRWLALDGIWRERARSVKAAVALAFLFQILSGLVLWIPRRLGWAQFRAVLWFRPKFREKLSGRGLHWNLHNVVGIWLALPLLAIVISGVIMAYPGATALLYRAAGSPPPIVSARIVGAEDEVGGRSHNPINATSWSKLDALVERVSQQDPNWITLSFRIPTEKDASVVFNLDGPGRPPQTHSRLSLNRKTGEVVRWEPFTSNSRGRQWRLYARYIHTGEILGVSGAAIAFLSCLGAGAMVWTGAALAWRRWLVWRKTKPIAA
jgi:uncharacterized iron-regulated membrane protein